MVFVRDINVKCYNVISSLTFQIKWSLNMVSSKMKDPRFKSHTYLMKFHGGYGNTK